MEHFDDKEKKSLYSLFKNIEKPIESGLNKIRDSDILLVDGMNLYLRAFSANPQLNDEGLHIGGIVGSLKSLGYSIKLLTPTRVIIIFDGIGGSVRRKSIFPNYKERKSNKVRLNRIFEEASTKESELQSLARQLVRLSHYIDNLPVTTIQIDNVEADDVVAYLALNPLKNSNITIMSSDKDFYQLIDETRIRVYSPIKKKIYGVQEILSEFEIHPRNFVLYRALDGDASDCIDGIQGCGLKTILKGFPFLSEDKPHTIQDVFDYSEENKGKFKIYETILQNKNIVERNYQLMQLSESIITTFSQLNINDILKKKNKLNRFEFNKLITEDKMWNAIKNHGVWVETIFKKLDDFVL